MSEIIVVHSPEKLHIEVASPCRVRFTLRVERVGQDEAPVSFAGEGVTMAEALVAALRGGLPIRECDQSLVFAPCIILTGEPHLHAAGRALEACLEVFNRLLKEKRIPYSPSLAAMAEDGGVLFDDYAGRKLATAP